MYTILPKFRMSFVYTSDKQTVLQWPCLVHYANSIGSQKFSENRPRVEVVC